MLYRTLVVFAALLAAPASRAAVDFQGLGDLPGGGFRSNVFAVSADGTTAVGRSSSDALPGGRDEAFVWTAASGITGIGFPGGHLTSSAFGISANGQYVFGDSTDQFGLYKAFRWSQTTGFQSLGTGQGADTRSSARASSADGSIAVGFTAEPPGSSGYGAFYWQEGSGGFDLGGLSSTRQSGAFDVSSDGSVVVGFSRSTQGIEAARWVIGVGLTGLGFLPGECCESYALGVSADGQTIVGHSNGGSRGTAFRWNTIDGMTPLQSTEESSIDSRAFDISGDSRTIVGYFTLQSAETLAFIWNRPKGMQRLDTVLAAQGADLMGWTLESASSISTDGRTIVGDGRNPDGEVEGWIATITWECLYAGAIPRSTDALATSQSNTCEDWAGHSQPGTNLQSAILDQADLTGANLNGSILIGASLTEANLTDISLLSAQVRNAALSGANLTSAELSFSNLSNAMLSGVNMTDAAVPFVVWAGAQYDESTVFPSGATYADPPWGLDGGIAPWDAGMIPVPEAASTSGLIPWAILLLSLRRRHRDRSRAFRSCPDPDFCDHLAPIRH